MKYFIIIFQLKQLSRLNNRYLIHYITSFHYDHKTYVILEDLPGSTLTEYLNEVKADKRTFEEHVFRLYLDYSKSNC